MSLINKFFSLAALTAVVALSATTSAQSFYYNPSATMWYYAPVLPAVQSSVGSYDKAIGNSWLGGSVHAYVGMVRQKSGTYELGNATAEFRGSANLLTASFEVAEIAGTATNVMNNGVQNRSGSFRVEVLGYPIINSSFANNSTFAAATSTYNLLGPNGVTATVSVGPVPVTLRANAGCSFSRSANWLLPAATATIGLNGNASAYAFANASVGVGVPGFSVGVGLQGNILQQTLGMNISASAGSGLSGGVTYTLQAITLQLYAYATAFWQTWTHTLCSWSAGQVVLNLI